ncbi:hypothetical protein BKA93DRAFT_779963 [Sparassis latifolia]
MSFWTETSDGAIDKQYCVLSVIVQLFSGLCTWDLIQCLPFDISFWRGKRVHARHIFFVYAGCRYISFVSVVCKVAYVCALKFHNYEALLYICQITYCISLAFAYQIFAIRIISLSKCNVVTYCVTALQIGLCICMIIGISQVGRRWHSDVFRHFYWVYLAFVSAIFLGLAICFLLRAHRRHAYPSEWQDSRSNTNLRRDWSALFDQLIREAAFDFVLVCMIRTVATVFHLIALDPSANLRRTIDYAAFIATIMCACHTFKTLSRQGDVHPFCLFYLLNTLQARREKPSPATPPESATRSHSVILSPGPSAVGDKLNGEMELDVFLDHAALPLKSPRLPAPCAPSCSAAALPPRAVVV